MIYRELLKLYKEFTIKHFLEQFCMSILYDPVVQKIVKGFLNILNGEPFAALELKCFYFEKKKVLEYNFMNFISL